ncbi:MULTISPECIES: hypothetical protein [unclassified Pseudomonas]|uniref:hypothetical protein n=1 Tax=unclassified Pseudomonas TaxID=196821 RepID=UPI00384B6B3A
MNTNGRAGLNPGDKPGVDGFPDNEGSTSKDSEEDPNRQDDVTDVDIDNAEFDDPPNPR